MMTTAILLERDCCDIKFRWRAFGALIPIERVKPSAIDLTIPRVLSALTNGTSRQAALHGIWEQDRCRHVLRSHEPSSNRLQKTLDNLFETGARSTFGQLNELTANPHKTWAEKNQCWYGQWESQQQHDQRMSSDRCLRTPARLHRLRGTSPAHSQSKQPQQHLYPESELYGNTKMTSFQVKRSNNWSLREIDFVRQMTVRLKFMSYDIAKPVSSGASPDWILTSDTSTEVTELEDSTLDHQLKPDKGYKVRSVAEKPCLFWVS